jgi:hypothetical protein
MEWSLSPSNRGEMSIITKKNELNKKVYFLFVFTNFFFKYTHMKMY